MANEALENLTPEQKEKLKKRIVLKPLNSKEDLRFWMDLFLNIDFPSGIVYPESTHGPIEAMWRIYELMKTGESQEVPQVTMLASRDSYKTLSAAAIEVLCMLHFRISMAHMAAIQSQSDKAVEYINSFFRRLRPYLEANGWKKESDNKRKIEWLTDDGQSVYLKIIIATISGANCIAENTVVVTADGRELLAYEVKKGDLLKTYDIWDNKVITVEVENVSTVLGDSREYVFEDGSNIILGNNHKVFTKHGWINAGNLKINDSLLSISNEKHYSSPSSSLSKYNWSLNSMLYGTLMGDANIQKLPSGNCRYQVFHCKEQLPYLEQIKKTFSGSGIKSSIIKDRNGYKLYTQTHEIFNNAYKICFPKDTKTINLQWMANIDLQSLAFLIMDDGTTHRKEVGKYKESPIDIAVMGFSEREIKLIIEQIKKLGYQAFLHRLGNYKQIRIPIDYSRYLSMDISHYFVDCLKYKLPIADNGAFFIDTGNPVPTGQSKKRSAGFKWESKELANLKKGRVFRENIKKSLSKKIQKINILGVQRLTGISIKEADFNLQSHFANGVLVHNSEHVPMLFIDEVDVVQNPKVLDEAKMIPSVYKNFFPLTVYLSTRKFAGGLMEKTLKNTIDAGGEVLRWNILDVTENIPPEVARVNEPKEIRYLARELPLQNISEEQWKELPEEKRVEYERFEAYAGIAKHPMLSVMKNRLVDRPTENKGNLWKPLAAVHNNFKQTPPDMGEAQLLCNKPSASGLVYPRFNELDNVLSVNQALKKLLGEDTEVDNFEYLKDYIKNLGIPVIGGADWGYTDYTVLVILAILPGGEVWHCDTVALPGLELDDIKKYGIELQEEWGVDRWYVDQAYPAYIKTLKRKPPKGAGWKIPKFKKVVADGITALQGKIVDSSNVRKYFVIDVPNNQIVKSAFGEYRWQLDGKGDVIEGKPQHDSEGISDVMDAIRYPAQNVFIKGSKLIASAAGGVQKKPQVSEKTQKVVKKINEDLMKDKIRELATKGSGGVKIKKKGRIFWG